MTEQLQAGWEPSGPGTSPQDPFALAFELAAVGMALLRPDGRLERANAALCELLGQSEAELRRFGMQGMVQSEDLEQEAATRARLLASESAQERSELRLRHKSGRTVWGSLSRILVRDASGEPLYFLDQVQDLTERRRAEKEIVLLNNLLEQRIRRRTAELEESNEDLRDFAYSLAHDLRAPLASIDGFSAQLEEQLQDTLDARSSHYLRRVRAGVRLMADLTDGLLALSDIARTDLQHQEVDLSALASDIVGRMRDHEPGRNAIVEIERTPLAKGDSRLLANVMENLLGNAWKFSGRNPVTHIRFYAQTESSRCCYCVRDNGAGFDPAYISKLFTPFHRLHTAAEFQGTGIGLALVRKIISRHGGRIWAESRPGEGAAFYFTLGENSGPAAG